MTYEEAKRNLIGLLGYLEIIGALDSPTYESLNTGIDVIEKADKYRWHDLRKDPNDLPKEDSYVLIKFCNTYKVAKYVDDFGDCYLWRSEVEGFCSNDVTAWREIEPFEG